MVLILMLTRRTRMMMETRIRPRAVGKETIKTMMMTMRKKTLKSSKAGRVGAMTKVRLRMMTFLR